MARNPTPAPESKETPVALGRIAQDVAASNTLAVIELSKKDYEADRDLANQLLGQAQMADSLSKLTQTVSISKLAFVKEHKLYKALKGKKIPHGAEFSRTAPGGDVEKTPHGADFLSGTWAEYCALLGKSEDQVDRDIANLQAFGQEALESMSAMGIGYRELRQYRRLPEDQKLALIEVAKAGDKEGFVELAEEIIAKHAKEKADLQQDLAAKDQRIARHTNRITELENTQDRWAALPVHAQVAESAAKALGIVQGELRAGFEALHTHHQIQGGDGVDSRAVMSGYLGQLQQQINALREAYALTDVVGDGTPAWKQWATANPNGNPNLPDSATWRPAA